MEHVPDLVQAMSNCLQLLCVGGILEVRVPYDLSYGAWQDPTHVRAFNERSWLYYTDWGWYIGWLEHRFDLIAQTYVASDYGMSLAGSVGDDLVALARIPRAIDELQVKLRKRTTSPAERENWAALARTA